jgi:Fe-S-cluster containining protein
MLVPWSFVKSWGCLACGHCCRDYAIPLAEEEWRGLSGLFGPRVAERIHDKKFLRMEENGRCAFLHKIEGHWLCSIQGAKPLACRLFPFKVCFQPPSGRRAEGLFSHSGRRLFIYVDADCRGIEWGAPSMELVRKVLPEFIGLKLKEDRAQFYSTAHVRPQKAPLPVRSILSACDRMDLPLAVME